MTFHSGYESVTISRTPIDWRVGMTISNIQLGNMPPGRNGRALKWLPGLLSHSKSLRSPQPYDIQSVRLKTPISYDRPTVFSFTHGRLLSYQLSQHSVRQIAAIITWYHRHHRLLIPALCNTCTSLTSASRSPQTRQYSALRSVLFCLSNRR